MRFALLALISGLIVGCNAPAKPGARRTVPAENRRPAPAPPPASPSEVRKAAASPAPGTEPTTMAVPTSAVGPRLYVLSRNVWVRSMPTSEVQWIGSLAMGHSVALREGHPVPGAGCAGTWVPIAPRGWVCADDKQATLDSANPTFQVFQRYRAHTETPFPHRYAWVHERIRRFETLEMAKPFLPFRKSDRAALVGAPVPELPPLPAGLSERRDHVAARSGMAYSAEGDYMGQGLLLAPDLSWFPRGDVELLAPVEFQGIALDESHSLPLAFFRRDDTPAFRREPDGSFVPEPSIHFARLSSVPLEGSAVPSGDERYYKLRGRDLWLSAASAVIPEPAKAPPWADGAEPNGAGGRQTWIEVSILGGWLLAYEGMRPVYATLVSPGRGGLPVRGRELVSTASTPTGRFSIGGKFKTATMESSSSDIIHSDVPWTQNFSGPHAIHSAYWHNDWGRLKSAGCVNVSPRDGKWLFDFTEPVVPPDWHGVRYLGRYGGSTIVVLHE